MSKNLIYFLNGSLGDFLMAVVFLREVHEQDGAMNIYVSTPKMKSEMEDLVGKYPYIKVIPQNLWYLTLFLLSKNYAVLTPTIGKNPWHIRCVSKILSWRGRVLDSRKVFRTDKLFIEMLYGYLKELNFNVVVPNTTLEFNGVENTLTGPYVVLHPFGSSKGRSILGVDLIRVFRNLQKNFPNHRVYITGSSYDASLVPEELKEFSVAGSSLLETASIIKGADLFVGVDTGTSHLANVMGKKCLIIASQGSEPYWLPFYNSKAKIIAKVRGEDRVYTDFNSLESKRMERHRYLENMNGQIICRYIKELADEL